MSKPTEEMRRLAVVMVLDMAGYSALMSRDEGRALSCVRSLEEILRAEIPSSGGRLVKLLGDGSLAEFPTAVSSVVCARRILDRIAALNASRPAAERFAVRIGLHLGELVDKGGDIFGDAVNIAARVQTLADPGGIAMTAVVYAQVKNQGRMRGLALPPQKLKNIPERVEVFLLPPQGASEFVWRLRHSRLPAAGAAGLAMLAASGWAWQRYASPARDAAVPRPPIVHPAPPAVETPKTQARSGVRPEQISRQAPAPKLPAQEGPAVLEVRVQGVMDIGGEVGVAVFNKGIGYPVHIENAYEAQWQKPRQGQAEAVFIFDSLPGGDYAVSVLHDEDGARRMERNESGFPKEGIGFSSDEKVVARAPRFSEAKFSLAAGGKKTILIPLDYGHRPRH